MRGGSFVVSLLLLLAVTATAQESADATAPPILPPGSLRFLARTHPSVVKAWRDTADQQAQNAGDLLAMRAAIDVAVRSHAYCAPRDAHCEFIIESARLIQRRSRSTAGQLKVVDDLGNVTHVLASAVRKRLKLSTDDIATLRKAVASSRATVEEATVKEPAKPPPASANTIASEASTAVLVSGAASVNEEEAARLVQLAIKRVPALSADESFKNLSVLAKAKVVQGLADVRQTAVTTADLSKVDSQVLYEQFGVVAQRWTQVVSTHATLLQTANDAMVATEAALTKAQASLESQQVQLDDLAQRIADSKADVSEELRAKFFTMHSKLARDTAVYHGMLTGIVPPQLVAGKTTVFNEAVALAAAQLAQSGDQNARLVSGVAHAAAGDLGSALASLAASGANIQAFGVSVPAESLVSIAQGGDPITALAGPVLTSVGLPPELGTLAIGLSTGNVFAAVGAFASLGGFSLGGSGGGGTDPAIAAALGQIQEQLGQIRQSLARIESRLDKIDARLDNIERQMRANHAAVMARLEAIGAQLAGINDLALRAVQSNLAQCNQDWMTKYQYEQLRDLLNASKVDDYRDCYQALKKTLGEDATVNPLFLLSVNTFDPFETTPLVKSFYAPHYNFLRASLPPRLDAREKAALLLGAGDSSIASIKERLADIAPDAPVPSRELAAADVLRPDRIVSADAAAQFAAKVLAATSLRPFINLTAKSRMVSVACAGQQACLSDNQAAYANPIEIEDLLRRTIRLVDTGVAQVSILDGDLALEYAVEVLTKDCGTDAACPDQQGILKQIMEMNEVYAKNVAHVLLRDLFEARYGPLGGAEGDVNARWDANRSYLYSFAFASTSPQLVSRVFQREKDARWQAIRFLRRDEADAVGCTKVWEGEGLYVRMRNGICVGLPEPAAFARGELARSRESDVLNGVRAALVHELVSYGARREAAVVQRALLDRTILQE
jgi:predicted  nucleic acid-binding Zn-ribbon protein